MTSRHERIGKLLRTYHQVRLNLTSDEAVRVFTEGLADTIDSEFDIPPAANIPMPEIQPPSGTAPNYVSHTMRPKMVPAGFMFIVREDKLGIPRGWASVTNKLYGSAQQAADAFNASAHPFGSIRGTDWSAYLQLKEVFVYA